MTGAGAASDRKEGAVGGHASLHPPLPVAEKEPSGSSAAAAAAAGACAEAPGRASKGGLEVRRRPAAATTALPRHVQDREVRGQ
ncbi:unnamed protein product [Miscanthus lutarioriparius]|uniref:Uncharacterized protein n=1 Tax=Miscanthus lutarioriparius TaxID=422564 RepID=A0A811QB71_9POAL|nr:unnamed protein product [Miscanthus lutarioriparius]